MDVEKNYENIGENFHLETYLEAQQICIAVTNEIIERVEPGMTEKDGQRLVIEAYKHHGIRKFWHGSKFRIGKDTLKDFSEKPDSSIVCEAGELCFVDLGPIINKHEADFGRTFIIGGKGRDEYQRLVDANKVVFDQVADEWRSKQLTGKQLLKFAEDAAAKFGYKLNPKMAGHRLSDFPHRVHTTKPLFTFSKVPKPHLWVLEIHLWDEKLERGAFYEDILI